MANKAVVTGTLNFSTSTVGSKVLTIQNLSVDLAGGDFIEGTFTVPTTVNGTALPLGSVTGALGWIFVKNNDPTNYVELLSAVSGTKFAKILPGEFALLRLPSGITAPAAQANTNTVQIEYLLTQN